MLYSLLTDVISNIFFLLHAFGNPPHPPPFRGRAARRRDVLLLKSRTTRRELGFTPVQNIITTQQPSCDTKYSKQLDFYPLSSR